MRPDFKFKNQENAKFRQGGGILDKNIFIEKHLFRPEMERYITNKVKVLASAWYGKDAVPVCYVQYKSSEKITINVWVLQSALVKLYGKSYPKKKIPQQIDRYEIF